jgi:hypothetical protein
LLPLPRSVPLSLVECGAPCIVKEGGCADEEEAGGIVDAAGADDAVVVALEEEDAGGGALLPTPPVAGPEADSFRFFAYGLTTGIGESVGQAEATSGGAINDLSGALVGRRSMLSWGSERRFNGGF